LGYLNAYPDHWTQGESLEDLKEHLRDLFQTFGSEQIPGIRKVEELEVAYRHIMPCIRLFRDKDMSISYFMLSYCPI
jgi:hypothetical protein